MISKKDVPAILRSELPYLRKAFGVKRIALFGSFARGTGKKGSDVDLFVEFDKVPGFLFMDLVDYLEKRIGCRDDVLTPEGLKSIRIRRVAEDIRGGLCLREFISIWSDRPQFRPNIWFMRPNGRGWSGPTRRQILPRTAFSCSILAVHHPLPRWYCLDRPVFFLYRLFLVVGDYPPFF
jgi:uncharacterized protein